MNMRILFVCFLTTIVASAAEPLAPSTEAPASQPSPLSHFPDATLTILRQVDGSYVCTTLTGIYLATHDPYHWSELSIQSAKIPENANWHPAGGDRHRLFLTADTGDDRWLVAVDLKKQAHRVCKVQSPLVAFASKDIGVICTGSNLGITTDAGVTWSPTHPLVDNEETISALTWISDKKVLVGGSEGSIQLFDISDKAHLRRLWTAIPEPKSVVNRLVLDGDHMWCESGSGYVRRVRLIDGKIMAKIKPEPDVQGISAIHSILFTWGINSIQIWNVQPKNQEYNLIGKIPALMLTDILPLEANTCLAIAQTGQGFLLDLTKQTLTITNLEVTLLPKPPQVVDPTIATLDELHVMLTLYRQLPPEQAKAITDEAIKKAEFTNKQQVEWITKQLKLAIDKKNNH